MTSLSDLISKAASDIDAAKELIAVGEMQADADVAADELAAYTTICLMLLNLDETLMRK